MALRLSQNLCKHRYSQQSRLSRRPDQPDRSVNPRARRGIETTGLQAFLPSGLGAHTPLRPDVESLGREHPLEDIQLPIVIVE